MASLRSAAIDPVTLNLYGNRLSRAIVEDVHLEDVLAAIEKIADSPREEGQPAIPEVAAVLSLGVVMSVQRIKRQKLTGRGYWVRFECPVCGLRASGLRGMSENRPQPCKGIALVGMGTCGGTMKIIHDERIR
jgi:hypothetical protein